ncbi:MAG: gliding motility-associated C-terminal domain-containing protein [Bacteroidota bacterium]
MKKNRYSLVKLCITLVLSMFVFSRLQAQISSNCLGAVPICSGTTFTYTAPTGIGSAAPGNNYGCLGGQPNPSWFYLQVGTSGTISINQTGPCDQDYALWGPFTSVAAGCSGLGAPISCSFTTAANNSFTINGTTGQFYILLVTNWCGSAGSVSISEAPGGGSLSCVPVCTVTASNTGPYCAGATITLNASNAGANYTYTWTGPNGFSATGQSVTIPNSTAANAGVYTVTATGAATCTGTTTVVVNPLPTINPTSNSPVCVGSQIQLSSGATGGTVAWTGPPGSGWGGLGLNPTINNAQPIYNGNVNVTVIQNGCFATGTVAVTVNPVPTASVSGFYNLCAGQQVPAQNFTSTPAGATFNWTNTAPGIGLPASGTGNIPAFVTTNNTNAMLIGVIGVTPTLNNCSGTTGYINVIVNPTPGMSTPASNIYCDGASVPAMVWTVNPSNATVAWSNDNTNTGLAASGSANIPTFVATNPELSQIVSTVTATPTLGACSGTPISYTITVAGVGDATITDIGPLCSDAGIQTLVAVDSTGTWSGPGIVDPVNGLFDPLIAGAGPHTINYSIPGQCGSTDGTQILVVNVPIVNAGLDFDICEGLDTLMTGSFTNSSTGSETFFWTPSTNLTGNLTLTPTYTANSSQTYTLTVVSGACSATDDVAVTVIPQSNATITDIAALCQDDTAINLTAANAGGVWSGSGIVDVNNGTFDPAGLNPNTYTITYAIGGFCPSQDDTDITVNEVFDGTVTLTGPFCQVDLPQTLTAVTPGGIWSGTGIANGTTGSFGSPTLASNTYTITYTTPGLCPRDFTTDILVNENFDATITAVNPVCNDATPFNLVAADAGGTWSGTGITNAANGTFDPNGLVPGPYTVNYDISGPCPASGSLDIEVLEVPDGTITPAGPFCQTDLPQSLTAATAGGIWSGTGITSAANGTFGSANTAAGDYAINYTTAGQCSQTFATNITVIANLDATISNAGPFCIDEPPYTLQASSAGGVWSCSSGNGQISSNGSIDPSILGTGTFTFNYNIDNNGCLSSDDVTVLVNPLPVPSFTVGSVGGCAPVTTSFTNTSNPLGSIAVWSVDGNPVGNGNSLSYTFDGNSCFDVGLLITDANGCSAYTQTIDAVCTVTNPNASFTWDPVEPAPGGIVTFSNLSLGGITYAWDIDGVTYNSEDLIFNVPSNFEDNFLVCLDVIGLGGCMDAQCYTVTLDQEEFIYIPNSFTPDNDGVNDVFGPSITKFVEGAPYSFKIFDRWGDVIFETSDPKKVWTGNVHDGDYWAEPDAYIYEVVVTLTPETNAERFVGAVILLR